MTSNWAQFWTILWLRRRLTRNQFSRSGRATRVLSVIGWFLVAILILLVMAGGVGIGFLTAKTPENVFILVFDAIAGVFLFISLIGLMVDIQRSESIDLSKLLHLPISLKQVFYFNYFASLASFSSITFSTVFTGILIGILIWGDPWLILTALVAAGFLFALTAWSYCLRGWLATLMANQRRKRTILMCIAIFGVLVGQVPNLVFNNPFMRRKRAEQQRVIQEKIRRGEGVDRSGKFSDDTIRLHALIPPLWLGHSALKLREHRPLLPLCEAGALGLLGYWGLFRAYRTTVRFYVGDDSRRKKSATPARQPLSGQTDAPRADGAAAASPASRPGTPLIERSLPGAPEDVSAVLMATAQSLLRAPEVKMSLLSPVIMLIVFGSLLAQREKALPEFAGALMVPGMSLVALTGFLQLIGNVFGFDRDAFRAFVLSPMDRKSILLGKNLAFGPFVLAVGLLFLIAGSLIMHLSFFSFLAAVCQLVAGFFYMLTIGNFLSIRFPYKISNKSLQPAKVRGLQGVILVFAHLGFTLSLIPLAAPAGIGMLLHFFGILPGVPIDLILALFLPFITFGLYRLFLPIQGRLLAERQHRILQIVTHEQE